MKDGGRGRRNDLNLLDTADTGAKNTEIEFEAVNATRGNAGNSTTAGFSEVEGVVGSDCRQEERYGGWDLWLPRKLELNGLKDGDKTDETCVRAENVGGVISEFKARLVDRQIDFIEDQGRFDRKMLINVRLRNKLNVFERNRASAEVQRTLAAPIDDQWEHHLGGARIKSPRRGRWPKPKQFGSTVWNRKEILKMYLNTTWRPTHSTVSVKGGRVDGIHCSSMAIRYVLENQGVLGEGWKVEADDLENDNDTQRSPTSVNEGLALQA